MIVPPMLVFFECGLAPVVVRCCDDAVSFHPLVEGRMEEQRPEILVHLSLGKNQGWKKRCWRHACEF